MSPGRPSDSENTSRHAAARLEQPESPPRLDGAREAAAEEGGIDALARLEAPDARADLRSRRIGRAAEPLAACRRRFPRLRRRAGSPSSALDRSGEHPRVPAPQRFLASLLEPQLWQTSPSNDSFVIPSLECAAFYL